MTHPPIPPAAGFPTMVAALRHATNLATLLGDYGFPPDSMRVGRRGDMTVHFTEPRPSARVVADTLCLPIVDQYNSDGATGDFTRITADYRGVPVELFGRYEPVRAEQVSA